MALAVENDMVVYQLDVTSAFLNKQLDEEVYIEVPELLEELLSILAKKEELRGIEKGTTSRLLVEHQKRNKVGFMKKTMYGN